MPLPFPFLLIGFLDDDGIRTDDGGRNFPDEPVLLLLKRTGVRFSAQEVTW